MKLTSLSGMFLGLTLRKPNRKVISAPGETTGPRLALVVVAVGIAVLLPIMIFGIPYGADLPNHLRFVQPFYEGLQSGHWYPAWLGESNDGFGDARFRFYPPGLYYLLAAARMVTGGWYSGTMLTLVLLSVAGGLGVYFWARTICEPRIAMWAGILYTIAPYHLNELYQASLLSEYAACSILPFAFAFTERICRKRSPGNVAGLAASCALLFLTHLPLSVIGSISLAIYAALRLERKHFWSTTIRLAAGVVLGLAASAFFWTKMLAELSWIKGGSTGPNPYYDYRLNFLFSPSALTNRNTWYANVLALAVIGFLLPGIALVGGIFSKHHPDRRFRPALLSSLVAFVMATALSRPLWAVIPKLSEVQFPWRWLSITSLAGSLLVAASFPKWKEIVGQNLRPRDLAVGLAFALSVAFVVTQIVVDCSYLNRPSFETVTREVRGAVSFKDWLPVGARDLLHLDLKKSKVDAGSRSVALQSWEPELRRFHVAAGSEKEARVRTYYYPLWVATADGQRLPTRNAEDGAILIAIPPNAVDVTLEFREPGRVHVATIISLFGWLLIAALFIARPLGNVLRRYAATANGRALATRPGADGALLISLPPEPVTIDLEFREPPRAKVSTVTSIISWTLLASLLIFGLFATERRQYDSTESSPAPAQ
jgi:hypothetical protein